MFCREDGRRGFSVDVAMQHGVDEAILLNHIVRELDAAYMLRKHGMGGQFEFVVTSGRPWLPWSIKKLQSEMPFWTEKQVRRIVASCLSQGLLESGNYGSDPFDRRLWYSVPGVQFA